MALCATEQRAGRRTCQWCRIAWPPGAAAAGCRRCPGRWTPGTSTCAGPPATPGGAVRARGGHERAGSTGVNDPPVLSRDAESMHREWRQAGWGPYACGVAPRVRSHLDGLADEAEPLLPGADLLSKGPHVRRRHHGLRRGGADLRVVGCLGVAEPATRVARQHMHAPRAVRTQANRVMADKSVRPTCRLRLMSSSSSSTSSTPLSTQPRSAPFCVACKQAAGEGAGTKPP